VNRRALYLVVAIVSAAVTVRLPQPAAALSLVNAHAHNDYEHAQPLLDALGHGFCSVEADVFLVNGELLVAHDADRVRADHTLQALYLDPLRDRAGRDHGHLYADGRECTLLIDVKSEAAATYAVLRDVLARYADILTVFRGDAVEHRAVLAIVSGNRSPALVAFDPVRYVALDGGLTDLDSTAPAGLVPWISVDWRSLFTWNGSGPIKAGERRMLDVLVARAHDQGRKIRFWGAPDGEACWELLWDAGADLINTDDLAGLEAFLRARQRPRE
jgi:hypothetical protein